MFVQRFKVISRQRATEPNPSQPVGGVSRAIVFSIRIGESEMVGRVIVSCEPLDPFVSSII